MPIKINGTTIIDENNLADTDLSNLSLSGTSVITSIANSTISSGNYMKHINTKSGTHFTFTAQQKAFTCPSNGWIITTLSNGWIGSSNSSSNSIQLPDNQVLSFPVCSGTVIWVSSLGTNTFLDFFPEV